MFRVDVEMMRPRYDYVNVGQTVTNDGVRVSRMVKVLLPKSVHGRARWRLVQQCMVHVDPAVATPNTNYTACSGAFRGATPIHPPPPLLGEGLTPSLTVMLANAKF